MKTSENVKEIFTELIKCLPDIENLYPGKKGYGYDYVPLENIIDMLKDKLSHNNLAFIQSITSNDNQTVGVCTRIIHVSGEWIEDTIFSLPTNSPKNKAGLDTLNNTQGVGSAITYLRRYGLMAIFGITGDKDLDANIEYKPNERQDNRQKIDYLSMIAKITLSKIDNSQVFGDQEIKQFKTSAMACNGNETALKGIYEELSKIYSQRTGLNANS